MVATALRPKLTELLTALLDQVERELITAARDARTVEELKSRALERLVQARMKLRQRTVDDWLEMLG